MKKYKKNFYVLDCETTQLKKPEPICIAACLYKNGKPGPEYKRFFMPEKDIKTEKIHGLTYDKLRGLHARKFTKASCEFLHTFLTDCPDLPIVTHGVKFDRDKVLKPAFEKVGAAHFMPPDDRWRCTIDMSERCEGLIEKSLDCCLDYWGFDQRDESKPHDATVDCHCVAKVYMKLIKEPPIK